MLGLDGKAGGGAGLEGTGADEDGPPRSILHAAYVGAFETVKGMVAHGVAADCPDPFQGSTALHWASFGGHLKIVRWLVKDMGADANRTNNDGCTPLMFACERGHTGVAQWLVREGGAQVNVKDSISWQTPLHRVVLNSQRHNSASTISDDEDLILWLVEAGANLTALDRFGNHVEELRSPSGRGPSNPASRSKLCDMIFSAREEEDSAEGAKERLMRRSSVRRRSTGDMTIQLSPKLEAKQRAPMSRRGGRKSNSSGGGRGVSPAATSTSAGGLQARATSFGVLPGSRQSQRRSGSGRTKGSSAGSSGPEYLSASPTRPPRGSGGSGGGAAAPAAGAGARMGGGPPAPAVAGVEIGGGGGDGDGSVGYMGEMVAMFGGGKAPTAETSERHTRRSSKDVDRHPRQSVGAEDDGLQKQSIRAADEALRNAGVHVGVPDEGHSMEEARRSNGAAQVVDNIRVLAAKKAAGEISEKDFRAKKGQILEMEQLRREAEEEARRRAKGEADDAANAILTSVGQNTPPPSPKACDTSDGDSEDEDEPIAVAMPNAKGGRETYKASDIERYTTAKDGPRVFGEVPDSVKDSLAAKEALREAAVKQGNNADVGVSTKDAKKIKEKSNDSSSFSSKDNGFGGVGGGGGGASATGSAGGVIDQASFDGGGRHDGKRQKKMAGGGGCTCTIM